MTDDQERALEDMTTNVVAVADALNNFGDVLNKFAERIGQVLDPKPAPLNRAQRRNQGKPRQGGRQRQLQAIMRLAGHGRTRRPAKRR